MMTKLSHTLSSTDLDKEHISSSNDIISKNIMSTTNINANKKPPTSK